MTAWWSGYRDVVTSPPDSPRDSFPGSFLDQPVRGFLDQLAARTPTPGGGGAAAVTGAMAAGLVAMAARFSAKQLPEAGDLADQADELRRRAAGLAEADARAYAAVLEAFRLPREAGQHREGQHREARPREAQKREALLGAALVPLEIAEIGARVARLALQVAEAGNPNLRGDAVTGALLAAASARSAASLVDINVGLGGLDPELSRRAARAVADAGDAAERTTMSAERAGQER
jgi:formiminotetrahydrofolate cyclodeaminase